MRSETKILASIEWSSLACDNSCTMSIGEPDIIHQRCSETNFIVESGISYKSLSRETGVARASIQRFIDGRQSIRLDMADRLAAFFGLNLVERITSTPGSEVIRSSSVSKAR